jgi:arylsulfatase
MVRMPRDARPNIIFLMDDQHRHDALGCVNPLVQTPTIDALAREGLRFDQAACQAPACVPSRYSMMTGLYPSQLGVRTNSDSLTDQQLPVPTLAQYFERAGYQTAGFGKTHWGSRGCSTRGFGTRAVGQPRDSALYEDGAVMMSDLNPEGLAQYFAETDPYGGGEENVKGYLGCVSEVAAENHRDGWVTQQCLKFLAEQRDSSRPLLCYLSFLKPHAGLNVPAGFEDLYNIDDVPDMPTPPWDTDSPKHARRSDPRMTYFRDAPASVRRQTVLRYWANCTWIDSMFGQVVDQLRGVGRTGQCTDRLLV